MTTPELIQVDNVVDIINCVALYYEKGASGNAFLRKEKFRAPVSRQVKTLNVLKETVRWVDQSLLLSAVRQRTVRQETTMARAGTLPDFLYEKDIVPGESVDLTGDVGLPDEYDTSSSAEEEETEDQVGEGSVRVATLDGEANFLLGRVSAFGRAVRFNSRFMFP